MYLCLSLDVCVTESESLSLPAYVNVQQVMQYKPGDYFGELALIKADVRAATVSLHLPNPSFPLDRQLLTGSHVM